MSKMRWRVSHSWATRPRMTARGYGVREGVMEPCFARRRLALSETRSWTCVWDHGRSWSPSCETGGTSHRVVALSARAPCALAPPPSEWGRQKKRVVALSARALRGLEELPSHSDGRGQGGGFLPPSEWGGQKK